jgi:outer membrane protein assembly factor BamB
MATLEVHDGQGRVQFIELERDHPILFGTSAHCEVVLEGTGINPVHGRIRWKRGRFKVEASPDAEYVLINGHKMATGSIDVGDEVAVGPCRIFLLRADEGSVSAGRISRGAPAQEGRTMIVPPPMPGAGASAPVTGRHDAATTAPVGRSRYVRPGDLPAEKPEWARNVAAGDLSSAGQPAVASGVEEGESRGLKALFAQALRKWLPLDSAPGEERIISSPLVVSLTLMLGVLVGMGFWLRSVIAATIAERTFNRALQSFEDGDYRTAIRDFEVFAGDNPEDPRAAKARVLRSLANVRQYITPNGSTWSSALEAARGMYEEFQQGGPDLSEAFLDEKTELAELVLRIGEGLADRARGVADPKALAEAESSVPLHAQIAGEAAPALLTRSRLPSKLGEARAAVRKSHVRTESLAMMDRALSDGSASRVYETRDRLVEQYADLAQDRELISRMTSANELIRKAVKVDTARKPAAVGPRPEPLGPPTSVVLRTSTQAPASEPAPGSIAFALAEGLGYAIDGATGAPLWQVPLGLASPFVPQAVPGESAVIAFDARSNELVRLDARTGSHAWRLALGERTADPPLVLGNQLVQVLSSGKLLFVSLESGELQATMNLGRPLARTPVSDETGRHLYVLGRQDILYVLNRDPLGCASVEYLGHPDGSVPCSPALLGRYLIIPGNDTLADSRWRVLVTDQEGSKIKPVQEIPVKGWTWQTPTGSGAFVWATGDRGAFEAFAIGEYGSKSPFRSVAKMTPDDRETGPAFALARSERELWSASGHAGRYMLDPEHGTIQASPITVPGPASAPIQPAGKMLVAAFQDDELGGTALVGLNPDEAIVSWKTVVGSSWSTEVMASSSPVGLSTLGRDGREVSVTPQQAARGGFVVVPAPRPGAFTLPPGLRLRLEREGRSHSVVVPRPYNRTLWIQDKSRREGWREATLPATVAADPILWKGGILVPGTDMRVYLVDPFTGRSIAEPFVPQFDRDRQGTWLGPAILDPETAILADDVGRVRRILLKTTPVPRLVAEAEKSLDSRIVADPATTGAAVLIATADGRVRSLAARDLSPIGAWPLEASLAGKPVGLGDGGLVTDRAGAVLGFSRDGHKAWSIALGSEVAGAPCQVGPSLVILTSDGVLHVRARSDGAERDRRPLGVLPSAGPIAVGSDVMIPVAPGTLRPLALEAVVK